MRERLLFAPDKHRTIISFDNDNNDDSEGCAYGEIDFISAEIHVRINNDDCDHTVILNINSVESNETNSSSSSGSTDNNNNDDGNSIAIKKWNEISTQIVLIGILFAIALFIITYVSWYCDSHKSRKINDRVKFVSLFKFIFQILDIFSDIGFCIILYLSQDADTLFVHLFIFSLFFLCVPYILSLLVIYWIIRWTSWIEDQPSRLKNWLIKYGYFLLFLTIISNFYSAVDLCQSKIFYIDMTNKNVITT